MCNLYSMTATVDEMRRVFGAFEGDTRTDPGTGWGLRLGRRCAF